MVVSVFLCDYGVFGMVKVRPYDYMAWKDMGNYALLLSL